jgi:hypothetical protein
MGHGRAISMPFRPVNHGQRRAAGGRAVRRSGSFSRALAMVPKLNTRVRSPSSALVAKAQVDPGSARLPQW